MPRYFFNTMDGSRQRDEQGVDLSDRIAARREAIRFAGSILSHEPDAVAAARDFRVEVTDEHEAILFTVIALTVETQPPLILSEH